MAQVTNMLQTLQQNDDELKESQKEQEPKAYNDIAEQIPEFDNKIGTYDVNDWLHRIDGLNSMYKLDDKIMKYWL